MVFTVADGLNRLALRLSSCNGFSFRHFEFQLQSNLSLLNSNYPPSPEQEEKPNVILHKYSPVNNLKKEQCTFANLSKEKHSTWSTKGVDQGYG